MTSRDYFERICERITTHEVRNLGQRSVFFFTSEWPYKEVNKFLEECDNTVQLYHLDPIVFKKEEIEKYSKYLPIEVSFKYVNHHFYLTNVRRIKK